MLDITFFKNKKVLVTGHTGFKGTWMCRLLADAGAILTGYSLAPPTTPNLFSLAGLDGKIINISGDVQDFESMSKVFDDAQPEIVIHMAAQAIVRESYNTPMCTYSTNVMGTVNILECVRTHPCVKSFLNITTDKVYKNKEWIWGYRENEPLDGFDPYSNSKSCSELVTHSYKRSFFAKGQTAVSTVRAGNVIGGGDFAQDRIIPDCVRSVKNGTPLVVRNPHSTRPYQFVLEPVCAYLELAQRQYISGSLAGYYNVGPDECDCVATGLLVNLFAECWGKDFTWEDHGDGGPHEANFLKLDCSKIKSVLGWKPHMHIQDAVRMTVEWTRVWLEGGDIPAIMQKQIATYLKS